MKPLPRLERMLKESGLCLDSAGLLDWIVKKHWRKVLFFRFLRLRFSPGSLERARNSSPPLEKRARRFSLVLSQVNVGATYKTTGFDRTKLADQAILDFVRASEPGAVVLEVGASDGSASLNLLDGLRPEDRLLLTDAHPGFLVSGGPLARRYYDGQKRLLGLRLPLFYLHLAGSPRTAPDAARPISTLNPLLAEGRGLADIAPFDIFRDRLDDPARAIKCANLLNRSYFTDQDIAAGAANLGRSLEQGGRLYVSQNSDALPQGEAWLALERRGDRLDLAGEENGHPCLDILRQGVALPESGEGGGRG